MLLSELHTLATKMARKRGLDEDAEQEAWVAAWRASQKTENIRYVAKSVSNRLNDYQRGVRLGTVRSNARFPIRVTSVVSRDALDYEAEHLAQVDWYPSNLSWAHQAARTPLDRAMLRSVLSGDVNNTAHGIYPNTNSNHWAEFRTRLRQAWKESE